ncbi:MAG: DUF2383 domain-containing protein [Clostridium sp.]
MQNNKEMVKEINKFLKGIHMGGTTFKDYLKKATNPDLKEDLKNIIESFKKHEEAITHRIEQLGGDAADTVGIMGMMAEFFEKIKDLTINTDNEVVEQAIKAIDMGIKQGEKFLNEHQNLDKSIRDEMDSIIRDYHIHLNTLKKWQ